MTIDEATANLLDRMASARARPAWEIGVAEARAAGSVLRQLFGAGPEMFRVEEASVATVDGDAIRCRILIPRPDPRAVIVYYHGGGWVLGDIDDRDTLGRQLAERTGCVVVLVGYRKAPEHPFPVPLEDAWSALTWVDRHAVEVIGTDLPLMVMGDSAGGNLATVVARRAAVRGAPELALQVLVYPVLSAAMDTVSYLDPANQLILTRESMAWFFDQYVPDPARRSDPEVSPLLADIGFGPMPPSVVVTAQYDVLCDEGEEYVTQLRSAGVPVRHRRFSDQTHGFFAMVNVLPGSAAGLEYVAGAIDLVSCGKGWL